MRLLLSILFAAVATTASAGQMFDLAPDTWHEVQRGEVDQWSLVVDAAGVVRLDLVHTTTDEGEMLTYFVARRPCANGNVEWVKLYPGNVSGIGLNCNGAIGYYPTFATWQGHLGDLPDDAQMLIH